MDILIEEAQRVLKNKLAPLMPYLENDTVNEVMINSHGNYFVEMAGAVRRVEVELAPTAIDAAIKAVMAINKKDTSYIMDARLPGFRVACALPPVAIHGPMMVIRKHATRRITLDDYVKSGAFDRRPRSSRKIKTNDAKAYEDAAGQGGEGLAEFLRWIVRSRKNLLLVGSTSSGKTTLLSACLFEIPDDDRIITNEDTNEIRLIQPNIVQLEAYIVPGIANITIQDLIRLCLRSRPDRIVVGELRGMEAYDFVDAMNTGHPGSLCTIHADSARLGLNRLESLIRRSPAANNLSTRDMRADIASAIDYVLFQTREDGVRAPEQVIALDGVDEEGDYIWRPIYDRFY